MRTSKITAHLRSNVVGYIAVFLALSMGTAYATHPGGVNTISSADIINGEVKGDDLAANSVGGGKIADRQVKNADLSIGASSSNTIADGGVQSIDIMNESLTGADLAPGSVESSELGPNAIPPDGITPDDGSTKLAPSSVGSQELRGDSVDTFNVVQNSLTGLDVNDGSLTDADTSGLVPYGDVLWAVVNSNGNLSRASNATTTSTLEATGTGDYEVNFGNGTLDPCASIAQISDSGFGFAGSPGEAASAQGESFAAAVDVRTFDSAGAAADRAFTVHVLCPEGPGGAALAKEGRGSHR